MGRSSSAFIRLRAFGAAPRHVGGCVKVFLPVVSSSVAHGAAPGEGVARAQGVLVGVVFARDQFPVLDERAVVTESLLSIKRAGADGILTYFAKRAARWLSD